MEDDTSMDFGLKGKYALVAGGGRGIGKAIARELSREGVDVVIASRSMDQLQSTAREIEDETGQKVVAMPVDVTDRKQVDQLVDDVVKELGGLHILVNSASLPGGSPSAIGAIENVVDEDLLNDFDVKYVGAMRCARAAIPYLKEQGWGRIVNISGANARNAGNLSGGARNGSLVHLTKTLATQLGRFGITVNCVHPGTTRTERTPILMQNRANELGVSAEEVEHDDFVFGSPRGNSICRMVDASEIAFLTTFLTSDKAWAITGEVIGATGGAGNAVFH
jgi:NAD(P)-dependent dehydrogenase (short-subunit alcohol dehydrogenase family)